MNKDCKVYDKNGTLLKKGDVIDTDGCTLEIYWDEWYIVGNRDCWKIEEFSLTSYKDGVLLVDFEKQSEVKK